MLPEQYQAIAAFCEGVTYNRATGELRGQRREFEPQLDHVLINRRRVEKGRIIAMLTYGYPHLLQPAAHLLKGVEDESRWALINLRYTYEPEALNPLGLAEGCVYFVRGGTLHRLYLPVGTQIQGHTVVSPSVDDIAEGSFILDANCIVPTLTTGEDAPIPTTPAAPEAEEVEAEDYDDLV